MNQYSLASRQATEEAIAQAATQAIVVMIMAFVVVFGALVAQVGQVIVRAYAQHPQERRLQQLKRALGFSWLLAALMVLSNTPPFPNLAVILATGATVVFVVA